MQTHLVVEFIIWLLIAASIIVVVAARLRIPYTVALVLGGLALGVVHTPFLQHLSGLRPGWLTCMQRRGTSGLAASTGRRPRCSGES